MKRIMHKALSIVLTLTLLVTMLTVAIVPAQAGLIANIITQNYTAIAAGTIERVTTTAISKAAAAAEDETLAEILDWTSRIVSGYQSVVNKTLIAATEEISQQLDDIYSLSTVEFATINDKLNQIIQEDAGDDFGAARLVVTNAGDKYQNIIGVFDDYLEDFIAYNNDPTDANRDKLEESYKNLCIDYKYVLNANSKDVFEEETFITPLTDGGFLKTVSPYNYNADIYVNDVADIADTSLWGTEDKQRETYLDALFDYGTAIYNFENNVYDLMSAGVNEVADAVSMYVQAYRYYVDLNTELINGDESLDAETKKTLTSRLEKHFEEYTLKAVRALNQMCEEYKDVFTTYMRTYDTKSTVYIKDYTTSITYGQAYPNADLDADDADRVMHTFWQQDRHSMEVYQFKLVNEDANAVYAIKTTPDGSTTTVDNYYPVYFAADTFSNSMGTFSLDVLNFLNGTTNGLRCITGENDISSIYTNNTSYVNSDTLINNIRRELLISQSSVELYPVAAVDVNAGVGAYMLLDTDIEWMNGGIFAKNMYADMTWLDVSKVNPAEVEVDVYSGVEEAACKNTQLNVMYKGTPTVSLDVNAISADSVANGTCEVYIDGNCVISDNGSASGLTSSKAMTLSVTPDADAYVSSIVLKDKNGSTLSTIYKGSQEDYLSVFGTDTAEICMSVPCQDTVIEVTYNNIVEEYTVSLVNADENVTLIFEDGTEEEAIFKELETVKVNVLPEEGYLVGIVKITDERGNNVSLTVTDIETETGVKGAKQYSFTMPEANVEVNASSYYDLGGDFIIYDYEDLCQMRDNVNNKEKLYIEALDTYVYANEARYIVANDIICPEDNEWTPVKSFDGTIDGKGNTISGLRFNGLDESIVDFAFIYALNETGTVKNLHFDDFVVNMNSAEATAALLVNNNSGTVQNCSVEGSITVDCDAFSEDNKASVSGLVFGSSGVVENCQSACELTIGENIAYGFASGLVSMNLTTGKITNCATTGDITCLSMFNILGGICSMNSGYVEHTSNTGDITSHGYVQCGGLCGDYYIGFINKDIYFNNCYTTGDITITEYENENEEIAAVWAGYKEEFIAEGADVIQLGMLFNSMESTSQNCYSTGKVYENGVRIYDALGTPESGAVPENSYILVDDSVEPTDASYKYMAQFESGEVAYLLNDGNEVGSQVWYQNLDNGEPVDESPVFKGGTVYKNVTCKGELVGYSNSSEGVVHNYNHYHVCKDCIGLRPGEAAGIYGFSIGLGGNISVNYYMVLDEEVASDETAKMVFTVPDTGSSYKVEIPVSEATFDGTFYHFTCKVAAKEIPSDIYCQIVTDTRESDNFRYSVKDYAEVILAKPDVYEKEIPLVKAMLNYGSYAQVYFDHNTDNLANTSVNMTDADKVLADALDLSEYEYTLEGSQDGVSYYGSALSLKSETAIFHYFIIKDDVDIASLEVTVNGEKAELVTNGNVYMLKISDIPAHKLDEMFEVKIGGLTLNYGAFSYGYKAMNGTKENLINVIKALYAYNEAAKEYIA